MFSTLFDAVDACPTTLLCWAAPSHLTMDPAHPCQRLPTCTLGRENQLATTSTHAGVKHDTPPRVLQHCASSNKCTVSRVALGLLPDISVMA